MHHDTPNNALSPASIAVALGLYLDACTTIDGGAFKWATRNCLHFAGGWWLRATGLDPLVDLAMPASAAAARRWLRSQGAQLVDLVGPRIARIRMDPRLARVGDLVALRADDALLAHAGRTCNRLGVGIAIGICTGRLVAGLTPAGGVAHVSMACALAAWPLWDNQAEALAKAA